MKLVFPQQQLWRVAAFPVGRIHTCTLLSRSAPAVASTGISSMLVENAASGDVNDSVQSSKTYLTDEELRLFKELHPTVQKQQPNVGAFQQLPMVVPSGEILATALRNAKRVQPSKGISNIAKREKNRGAQQLDALMKELSVPLTTYFKKFPRSYELHAYERSLLEFTLGKGKYEEVLNNLNTLRKKITGTGKSMAGFCAKASNKKEAVDRKDDGIHQLTVIFNEHAQYVEDLKETAKTLRRLPVVNPRAPVLCLVGAPNVGKSSLVRVLSTGKPEVCDYPFTTRAISMGHIVDSFSSYQVTDTPGLLNRKDVDRNDMEKLTLAALAYLPAAVLYVHDLTGECGTSVENQFQIYKEIRGRFPNRPWIDAVSKADLLGEPASFDDAKVDELARYKACGPPGALWVSTETKQNVPELTSRVYDILRNLAAQYKNEDDIATETEVA